MGSDQSAYELFDRTLLRVPDYQRGYAWERRHLEEFWEDIEVLPIEARHYTGTVVLLRRPELRVRDDRRVHYDVADIVDGQQRLTTLVLALNEVRRHLEQVGADRPAAQIAEHYLWVQRDGRRQAILQLGADIDGFWQRQVLADDGNFESPSVHSERRLLQARAFFEDRVTRLVSEAQDDATARLLELNDKLTEQLRFTRYEVDDASQVGVIFETLNDRGKPLTELEKAKNYLLFLASGLDDGRRRALSQDINHSWARVYERLMHAGRTSPVSEDAFLRANWLMSVDPNPRNWGGTASLKRRFPRQRYWEQLDELCVDVRGYAVGLERAARAFADIHHPTADAAFADLEAGLRSQVQEASERLRRVGALATFQPLLMAVRLTHVRDAQLYLDVVESCERFAFRVYRLRGFRSNTGQTRMYRLAHEVYVGRLDGAQLLGSMRHEILRRCSSKAFEHAFAAEGDETNWYGWGGLRYFLYEYELHLTKGRPEHLTWQRLARRQLHETIEHILPQSPRRRQWSAFNAAERARLTHDLGNLVLTLDNSHYSNRSFAQKRGTTGSTVGGPEACYARSLLIQERQIADHETWTPADVRARKQRLIAWAKQRWGLSGEDDPAELDVVMDPDEQDAEDVDPVDVDAGDVEFDVDEASDVS